MYYESFACEIQSDEFTHEYEEYLRWCEEVEGFHEPEE